MDSERIREERMRKAYLALLTGFVMTGCTGAPVQTQNGTSDRIQRKNTGTNDQAKGSVDAPASAARRLVPDQVQYMLSPAGAGSSVASQKAVSIYQAIQPGMREKDVLHLLAPVLLESGVESGRGSHRGYYRIGPNAQFWVEYSGAPENGISGRKSAIEPKSAWKRYPSGSIEIVSQAGPDERLADKGGVADAAAGR